MAVNARKKVYKAEKQKNKGIFIQKNVKTSAHRCALVFTFF